MKSIKVTLQKGVSNMIVTDINDVESYPVVTPSTLEDVINDFKVLHNNAASFSYVPQDLAANLIKSILILHPTITGNEINYPVTLGEVEIENHFVQSLTNLINSI